jgi:hypothetical protein
MHSYKLFRFILWNLSVSYLIEKQNGPLEPHTRLLLKRGGASWFKGNVSESLGTLTVLTVRSFVVFLSPSSRISG